MSTPQGGLRRAGKMFRALSHRNYRLMWTGAFLSGTGSWMQTVAQSWLVLELTNSAFWLGLDTFMASAPGLLLTLPAGVYADLFDRKRLLIFMQAGAGLSALVLAALVWAGAVEVWMVLGLTFVTGCCWSVAGPSFQAMTIDLVEREDLTNAIALNSTQFQLARVVGPLLAALTIKFAGLAGCFLINGLSYLAIVAALAQVKFKKDEEGEAAAAVVSEAASVNAPEGAEVAAADVAATPRARGGVRAVLRDLLEGFSYVKSRPRVSLLILCSAVVSLFGAPYLVLMPVFAKNVFGWGETGLSLLMGTAGAGALCGALMVAYLGDFRRKGRFALTSAFSAAVCVVGFSTATRAAVALPLLFGIGFSMVSFFAVGNALVQHLVTDRMRGRVMSMWILTFIGTMPLGSFLSGAAAERFGPRWTLTACGLFIALFVVWVAWSSPRLREL
ncbi:MAG TPA: MFS transporter [Pyrinomonadaceae bacterium]|nr:MFS transporter [Pyrinomonadaceae bacterium]